MLEKLIMSMKAWDHNIQYWVSANHQSELITFFTWMTSLGNSATIIVLCSLVSIMLLIKRHWQTMLILDVGLSAAWFTMALLKLIFGRVRPLGEHLVYAGGYSFPSGHAMLSMVFYGFVAYIFSLYLQGWPRLGVQFAAGLLILLIGCSRVYLNVHYSSDVMAGFFLGSLFLLVMIHTHNRMDRRHY